MKINALGNSTIGAPLPKVPAVPPFARMAVSRGGKPPARVEEYKLTRTNLNILDTSSKTFFDIKSKMGVDPFAKIADPMFARILRLEMQDLGYDGAISDNKADGMVLFDGKLARLVNTRPL